MVKKNRASNMSLRATAVALLTASVHAASHGDHEPECSLPPNIRPVVTVGGFGSGVLFDQTSDPFTVAFPDLQPAEDDGFFGSPEQSLALPLTWNAANLTQDASDLGSEGAPEDVLPGLVGPVRDALIEVRISFHLMWYAYHATVYCRALVNHSRSVFWGGIIAAAVCLSAQNWLRKSSVLGHCCRLLVPHSLTLRYH